MLSLLAPNASAASRSWRCFCMILESRRRDRLTRSINGFVSTGMTEIGAEMTEGVMTRLRFSRQEIDLVVEAVRNHMIFKDVQQMRPPSCGVLWRVLILGSNSSCIGLTAPAAMAIWITINFSVNKASEYSREPLIPARLVRGDDLISMGLKPGTQNRRAAGGSPNRPIGRRSQDASEALIFKNDLGTELGKCQCQCQCQLKEIASSNVRLKSEIFPLMMT